MVAVRLFLVFGSESSEGNASSCAAKVAAGAIEDDLAFFDRVPATVAFTTQRMVLMEKESNPAYFDGFWMVLAGRVRFYGPGDALIGEFGKYEGILIPRGEQYWFESASDDEELEILQMAGFEKGAKIERVDAEPQKLSVESVYVREVTQNR